MADVADGGDVLDLADLLPGASAANLSSYLNFEHEGGSTTIRISSSGDIGNGYDQSITLAGVDLSSIGDDQTIINDLISRGKLVVD